MRSEHEKLLLTGALEAVTNDVPPGVLRHLYRARMLAFTLARFPSVVAPWIFEDSERALALPDVASWHLTLLDAMDGRLDEGGEALYALANLLYAESRSTRTRTLDVLAELSVLPQHHQELQEFRSRIEDLVDDRDRRNERRILTRLDTGRQAPSPALNGLAAQLETASSDGINAIRLEASDRCGFDTDGYTCLAPRESHLEAQSPSANEALWIDLASFDDFGLYPPIRFDSMGTELPCWPQRYVVQRVFDRFAARNVSAESDPLILGFDGYVIPLADRFAREAWPPLAGSDWNPAFRGDALWAAHESGSVSTIVSFDPDHGTDSAYYGNDLAVRVDVECDGRTHLYHLRTYVY